MKLVRTYGASILCAALILAGSATGASAATRYDRQVLTRMHHVNQMEIRMGRLAMTKGRSPAVRQFGRRLLSDHMTVDRRVRNVAAREGIRLTNPPPTLHERNVSRRLRNAHGYAFDRQFLNAMADGHDRTIQDLRDARRNVSDPQVRRLITNTLPGLRHHRNMARNFQDQL